MRQEITKNHVRVGVLEPGGLATELGSHNTGVVREGIDAFYESTEVLQPEDIADGIAFMVTRPRRASIKRAVGHAHRPGLSTHHRVQPVGSTVRLTESTPPGTWARTCDGGGGRCREQHSRAVASSPMIAACAGR